MTDPAPAETEPLPAEEIRRTAEEILARSEYQPSGPGWMARLRGWLFDHVIEPVLGVLNKVVEFIADLVGVFPGVTGSMASVLGWLVVLVIVGVVAWALYRFLPRGRLPKVIKAEIEIERDRRERIRREQWLALARQAEEDGDFTRAVRARYRALTVGLADRNELDPSEAVTSGEHRAAFADPGPRGATFASLTTRYEDAWFGEAPVGPEDAARFRQADQDLLRAEPEGSR